MGKTNEINGAQPNSGLEKHTWPADGGHLWSNWMANTAREGATLPTQYRICLHPDCKGVEVRNV